MVQCVVLRIVSISVLCSSVQFFVNQKTRKAFGYCLVSCKIGSVNFNKGAYSPTLHNAKRRDPLLCESLSAPTTANLKQSALAPQPPSRVMHPVHNFGICQLQLILNRAPIFCRGARGRRVRCKGSTKCMKFVRRSVYKPCAKSRAALRFLAKHFVRSLARIRCSGA